MKTIAKLCVALLLLTSIIGCSSDDDSNGDTSADLIGNWSVTSLEYDATTRFDFLGETINSSFDAIAQNLDLDFTFTENPNEYTADGSYDLVVDATIDGISQTETTSIDNIAQEGTWERNGNILSIDGEIIDFDLPTGETMGMGDFTILELTETTLRLSQDQTEEVTQDGITVSFSVDSEIVFTRQ